LSQSSPVLYEAIEDPFHYHPEEDIRSPLIISLQICPKPICCITSRRNGHDTESNALKISNLRRILDYFY
jgi:hypothetical protein